MLIRALTVFSLFMIAACGQEAAVEAPAPAAPAAVPTAAATLARKPAPPDARAYIISPANGATVESPVRVLFGLSGFGVVPAGIQRADAGHHHLLIDTDVPNLNGPVPADSNHLHFGLGQTETEIELAPGTHSLQLLLGDELHVPHDPPILSERITIEVR